MDLTHKQQAPPKVTPDDILFRDILYVAVSKALTDHDNQRKEGANEAGNSNNFNEMYEANFDKSQKKILKFLKNMLQNTSTELEKKVEALLQQMSGKAEEIFVQKLNEMASSLEAKISSMRLTTADKVLLDVKMSSLPQVLAREVKVPLIGEITDMFRTLSVGFQKELKKTLEDNEPIRKRAALGSPNVYVNEDDSPEQTGELNPLDDLLEHGVSSHEDNGNESDCFITEMPMQPTQPETSSISQSQLIDIRTRIASRGQQTASSSTAGPSSEKKSAPRKRKLAETQESHDAESEDNPAAEASKPNKIYRSQNWHSPKQEEEEVRSKPQPQPSEDSICRVCLKPKDNPMTLECGHEFCRVCAQEWLKLAGTCPLCRHSIDLFEVDN